jgi:hypothetical protein
MQAVVVSVTQADVDDVLEHEQLNRFRAYIMSLLQPDLAGQRG